MNYNMLFVSAVTPLHCGAGEGIGLIDRPIMRERKTQFPLIQASSLKGVLRDACKEKLGKSDDGKETIDLLFGPSEGNLHAGAISFGDAQLLAFPVRSLKGCFVWATSPLLLYRFHKMWEIDFGSSSFPKLKSLVDKSELRSEMTDVFICESGKDALLVSANDEQKIVLEEFPKRIRALSELGEFATELAGKIFQEDSFLLAEFTKKLLVLPEDTFRYFVTHATEVVPNIKIHDETGTSKEGLRYSEYLPSETILYSLIGFEKARSTENLLLDTPPKVQNTFQSCLPTRIQLGADETKGKGIVELKLI